LGRFAANAAEIDAWGKPDVGALATTLTMEMKAIQAEIEDEHQAASPGSPDWNTLCCKAMAWAEQVTIEACREKVCGEPPKDFPSFPLGALIASANQLQQRGYPMPSIRDGISMFFDLWISSKTVTDWGKRFAFGRSLCE